MSDAAKQRNILMAQIRAILLSEHDGLPIGELKQELADRHGFPGTITRVRRSATKMVDVYVDRWQEVRPGVFLEVYAAVEVPPDAPKPVAKKPRRRKAAKGLKPA